MKTLFGPAGNAASFAEAGFRATVDAPAWIAQKGLTAYEYQCGRGVRVGTETAQAIGQAARDNGITLSLHAPYFINLSTETDEQREKNVRYVLESCRAAQDMGADRIVVHTGGLGKRSRETAMRNSRENVRMILECKEQAGYDAVTICLETMGKINVIGTAEEIMELVALDDRLLPCIDFGHLNARTHGGMRTREDVIALFDMMENTIGIERAKKFHSHFSKIEYGKGGEVRHLNFTDTVYGPDFEPVAIETAARGYTPRFICESAGTQAEDAVTMMHCYQQYMNDRLWIDKKVCMMLKQIQKALQQTDYDAVLITSPQNRRYVTGFPSSAGVCFVDRKNGYLFTDFRYIEAAKKRIGEGFAVEMVRGSYANMINDVCARDGVEKIGFEEDFMTCKDFETWTQALRVPMMPMGHVIHAFREIKTQQEIDCCIAAQRIAEHALEDVLQEIHPGVTEKHLASLLTYRMLDYGGETMSFEPIVISGKKSSMPHGVPSDKKVEEGDFVMMDFGCTVEGYCSDMTRTVAVHHTTEEMEKIYDIVLQAQLAGIAAAKPGAYCHMVVGCACFLF